MFDELGEPLASRVSRAPTTALHAVRLALAQDRSLQALDELRTLAARGDALARYWLGLLFEHGAGLVGRNAASARRWYRLAVQQGEWPALIRLTRLEPALPPSGVDASFIEEQRRALEEKAAAGDAGGEAALGDLVRLGQGRESAERWYARAAAQGHAGTVTLLAQELMALPERSAQQTIQAFGLVLMAGDVGDATAQYLAGCHYRDGEGCATDLPTAARWFRAAALQGHRAAMRCLAALGAADAAAVVPAPGGVRIEICAGGVGTDCLREGWGDLGIAATWTVGPLAVLELPARAGAAHLLKVEIAGIFPPWGEGLQRIVPQVNGATVGGVVTRGAGVFEFLVPAEVTVGRDAVLIALGLPDARAAATQGAAGDERFLGLRVAAIEWQAESRPAASGPSNETAVQEHTALMHMESLGMNCEFGFVQRSRGAEPLGLLRWALAPLEKLVPALEADLKDDPGRERLRIEIDAEGEFVVEDAVYGLRYHSLSFATKGATLEQIKRAERLRVGMLSRALTERLREGRTLWVYHDADRSPLEAIQTLVAALNRPGPNTLLWITGARPDLAPGRVRRLGPRLLQGSVTGFDLPVDTVSPNSPHRASWLEAALAAYRLWRA